MKKIIYSNYIDIDKHVSFYEIDNFFTFLEKNKIKLKRVYNKLDEFYIIIDGNHRFDFIKSDFVNFDNDDFNRYFEIVEEKEVTYQEIFLFKKLYLHQQREIDNDSTGTFRKGNININLNKNEIDFIYEYIYTDCSEGVGFYIKGLLELSGNNYNLKGKLKGLYNSFYGGPYSKGREIDFSFSNMETLKKQLNKKFQSEYYVKNLNSILINFKIENLYFDLDIIDKNDFEIIEEEDKKSLPEIFIYNLDGDFCYCI